MEAAAADEEDSETETETEEEEEDESLLPEEERRRRAREREIERIVYGNPHRAPNELLMEVRARMHCTVLHSTILHSEFGAARWAINAHAHCLCDSVVSGLPHVEEFCHRQETLRYECAVYFAY